MQFLMGFNRAYDHVKNHLILMDPISCVNKAYLMIFRVKRQITITGLTIDNIDNSLYNNSTKTNLYNFWTPFYFIQNGLS